MIQLINVNKGYEDNLILEDINITIDNGTVLGLVGPNGAGKSTILRLIAGVIQADAGVVAVNEYDIFDNDEIKQSIYFLGDDPYFFNQSTLNDMKNYVKIFYKNFDDDYYDELVTIFSINPNELISSFSKGMKRQAALIIAIAARPDILLMDESFDGLDPLMRFKLKQSIVEQLDRQNMIIIITSHSMGEIQDICDSIILVNNKGITLNEKTDDIHIAYHKFQLAFDKDTDVSIFDALNPYSVSGSHRIFTLVLKGDLEEINQVINNLNPIIVEHNHLSLDEIFRLEMEEQ